MLWKVFSIYDSKAAAYGRPFVDQSNGSAIRSVSEAANDKSTTLGKYPADFTLFELGTFDELSGKFDLLSAPFPLGCLIEFVVGSDQRFDT